MTFSLRRKLPIILRAALRKQAATITSALILFSILASAQGQNYLTPKFVATPKPLEPFPTVVPAHFQRRQTAETDLLEPAAVQVLQWQKPADDGMDDFIRTELPGPQRLFMRESEAQFYERLAQKAKKRPGPKRQRRPRPPPARSPRRRNPSARKNTRRGVSRTCRRCWSSLPTSAIAGCSSNSRTSSGRATTSASSSLPSAWACSITIWP